MTTDDQNNKKRPVSKRTVPPKPPGPLADWQEHPQVSPETYQKHTSPRVS